MTSEDLFTGATEEDPIQLTQQAPEPLLSPVIQQRQRAKLVHVKYGVIQFMGRLSIGRSKQADVTIKPLTDSDNDSVVDEQLKSWHFLISNMHCVFQCNHNNQVTVVDDSANGTFVNGMRLRRGDQRILTSGDEISLIHPSHPLLHNNGNGKYNVAAHYSFTFVSPPPPSSSAFNRGSVVDVRQMKLSQDFSNTSTASSNKLSSSGNPLTPLQVKYELLELLGKGTCGEVRRARHRQSGDMYAIKAIPLPKTRGHFRSGKNRPDPLVDAKREATLLRTLRHPYVIRLHESYFYPNIVHLVMDLVSGGDLFDRIVLRTRFEEGVSARRLMRRLFSAIHHLHNTHHIVHRDLKPENILLLNKTNDYELKVTDFGVAKMMDDQGLKTFCGTPQYFAPEVLSRRFTVNHHGRYDFQADVWSLGVIMYIVLFGVFPFEENCGGYEVLYPSQFSLNSDDKENNINISDDAKNLIQKLLVVDPNSRISIDDACSHNWFSVDDGDTHCYPLDDPLLKGIKHDIEEKSFIPSTHQVNGQNSNLNNVITKQNNSAPVSVLAPASCTKNIKGLSLSRERSKENNVDLKSNGVGVVDDEVLSDFSDDNINTSIAFPRSPPGRVGLRKDTRSKNVINSSKQDAGSIFPNKSNPTLISFGVQASKTSNHSGTFTDLNRKENYVSKRRNEKQSSQIDTSKHKKKLQSTLHGGVLEKEPVDSQIIELNEVIGQSIEKPNNKHSNRGKQATLSSWFTSSQRKRES